jgi:hypothetical protein
MTVAVAVESYKSVFNYPKVFVTTSWANDSEVAIHVATKIRFEVLAAAPSSAITKKLFGSTSRNVAH